MRRRELLEWKAEPDHAGRNGARQENGGPAVEPLRLEPPKCDNKSRPIPIKLITRALR